MVCVQVPSEVVLWELFFSRCDRCKVLIRTDTERLFGLWDPLILLRVSSLCCQIMC